MTSYYYFEYSLIFYFLIASIILAVIIIALSYIASYYNPDNEKLSSYECGFEPYDDARNHFDVHFYIVALLFLVFDLETVFIFPWSVSISFLHSIGIWTMLDFLFELIIGYVYAYAIGALDWN